MNYKARYNRIKDKVTAMPLTEKAETVCCRGAIAAAEGTESLRTAKTDVSAGIIREETREISYPAASMLACGFDTDTAEEVAATVAEEYRSAGKNFAIGPSGAIMRSPLDGMNSSRFSEEPYLTGKMAASFLRGLRKRGVEGCLTELGCGHSEDRKYTAENVVEPGVFGDLYLESFRIAVSEGEAMALLMSDAKMNDERLWLSRETTERLRKELSFDGAFVRPAGAADDPSFSVAAGADLLLAAESGTEKRLAEAVKRGKLDVRILDSAAVRVSAIADSLKDVPVVLGHDEAAAMGTARRAARECMVLLKNEDSFLPLKDGDKVAIIGSAAEKRPEETYRMFSSLRPSGKTLLEGLGEYGIDIVYAKGYNADGSTNPGLVHDARNALKEAGKGILTLDLPSGTESEGYDRKDMKLPDGMLRLADFLLEEGLPLACVIMSASPVEMPFEYGMKSILFTGHCGDATGTAAADILTGRIDPSGRLAFSWPSRTSMIVPSEKHIYREGYATGHRSYELGHDFSGYPFGYGLSYSQIEYLGSRIDKHVIIGERQTADILVRIKNNGERASAFVAQVYLRRGTSRMRRLAAFKKIWLLPGQIRNEHIEVEASRFREFDPATSEKVFCAGQYTLELAVSAGDEGVLESFDMSVFPKEWNTVPSVEEWNGDWIEKKLTELKRRKEDAPRTEEDVTFRDVHRTMAGRALLTELKESLDSEDRHFLEQWKDAVLDMPAVTAEKLVDLRIDSRMVLKAVRATVRKEAGGLGFGK
ncbi:MAG: glycoside hydrolase family 3 C-terminal domain-containing protein [Oscillospiraceae bacterium]|nr:glycoside hydrolase family 3 C-terminal domain-containing protein [Oscillospiraceae bacterium]